MKIFDKLARFSFVVKSTVGRLIAELSFSAPPSIIIIIHNKIYFIMFLVKELHFVLLKLFFCMDFICLELAFGLQMQYKCLRHSFYLNRKDGRSIDGLSH